MTDPGYRHPIVKSCGTCSLCCKVMVVPEINKPAGQWCRHFAKGVGCTIHDARPHACSHFQCYWSISEVLGEEWRPDRAKFVLWSDNEWRLIVEVDPSTPSAWKREPFYSSLKTWSDTRRPHPFQVLVRAGAGYIVVLPEADIDMGPPPEGHQLFVGYRTTEAGYEPYAEWRPIEAAPGPA